MSGVTTNLVSAGVDASTSGLRSIGFTFPFMGNSFTQFSVNEDGVLQLGGTAVTTNVYNLNGGTANSPRLAAFNADLKTGTNGKVHFKELGVAPNRKLVIEFLNINLFYNFSTVADGATFQIVLHETTGEIEYIYGMMNVNSITSPNKSPSIGFYTGAAANLFANILYSSHTANTVGTFGANPAVAATGAITQLSSNVDGERRRYSLTPQPVIAPTNLTFSSIGATQMTLNWLDNASNEVSYKVYSSLDGVSYNLVATLPANTTSYLATSLNNSTLYYWSVEAVGNFISDGLIGSETTLPFSFAGGIKTVGAGGDFENLTTAFAYINSNGLLGDVELQLIAGYPAIPETYPILTCNKVATSTFNVKVYPTVAGLSITSANATGTLLLDNAENVTFDGRINQVGASVLDISNTGAGYAVQFVNDASNNTLQYVTINSGNVTATSGTIVFGGSNKSTGNDNNLIDNCLIGRSTTSPRFAIYSAGTSGTVNNNGNTISNSSIFDYFAAGVNSAGIYLASNSSDWTITGNKFYQTQARIVTSGSTHRGIHITTSNGSGYVITNNTIGFGDNSGSGFSTYTGTGTRFVAMDLTTSTATAAIASSIQGNIIGGISISATTGTTTAPGVFTGIFNSTGKVAIGNVLGNQIGIGGINATITTSTSGTIYGIYSASTADPVISNNTVSNLVLTSTVATVACNVTGIYSSGGTNMTISNNTIGGSTTNALVSGTAGVTTGATAITGIDVGSVTNLSINGNAVSYLRNNASNGSNNGIKATTSIYTVSNNTISDLSFTSTAGSNNTVVFGYVNTGSPTNETISNNRFSNFSIAGTGTSTTSLIYGIYSNSTTSTKKFSGNQINDFNYSNSSTGSVVISGIHNLLGTNVEIFKNKIYNLSANGVSSVVNGIQIASLSTGGSVTVYNNLISNLNAPTASIADAVRGIASAVTATNSKINLYYNTIYLNATSSGTNFGTSGVFHTVSTVATTGTLDMANNIIINESTATGGGFTAGLRRSGAALTNFATTSNRNLLYAGVPSANNTIYYNGTTGYSTMLDYQGAVLPREVNSLTGEMGFITGGYATPNNFFISLTPSSADFLRPLNGIATAVESGGVSITSPAISLDYADAIRQGSTGYTGTGSAPDIGAYEFEGLSAIPEINFISSTPDFTTQCVSTPRVISVEILPTAGTTLGATIVYSVNGVPQTNVVMVNVSGNIWEGTIPAVTPGNANVNWVISAQNSLMISGSYTGTQYADEPNYGLEASIEASSLTLCEGNTNTLTAKLIAPMDVAVGTGTTATSGTIATTPFYGGYGGAKTQYIIRASELAALGFTQGLIDKIGIDIATAGAALQGFAISIDHTALTAMTTNIQSVTNEVYSTPLFTPVVGVNTFTFTNPFNWDGVSNVIISFCYSNNNSSNTTSQVRYSTTSFVSGGARAVDNISSAVMCSFTGSTGTQFSSSNSGTSSNRPNFIFGVKASKSITSITWSDGISVVGNTTTISVSPTVTTTYTANLEADGCTFSPSPTTTVIVNSVPTAPTASNATHCGTQVSTATVISTSSIATPTFNWYTTATGGTAVQSSTSSTFIDAVAETTTFYVSELSETSECESPRVPVVITVIPADPLVINTSTNGCLGQSFDIEILNGSSTPTQDYTFSTISTSGSGLTVATSGALITVNPTAVGVYTYDVTATDGECTTVGSVTVTVNLSPINTVATASSAVVCEGTTVDLSSTSDGNTSYLATAEQGFNSGSLPTSWRFINRGNGSNWTQSTTSYTGSGSMQYSWNSSNAGNAWAYSPKYSMVAGETYSISFWYKVGGSSFPEKLKVTIGTDTTLVAQGTTLWDNNGGSNLTNSAWQQANFTYTPTSSGDYNVAFNCYSAADMYTLYVDDISIQYTEIGPVNYAWTSDPVGFTSTEQNPAGVTPTVSTTYYVTATNEHGCSQTASVAVDVNQSSTSTTEVEECSSFTWNGTEYTTSGVYTFNTTTINGCDSVATLNLTINQPTLSSVEVSACESYTWPLNSQMYTASGNYTHTIPNVAGCDSVITLTLTILDPTASTVDISACDTYTWELNGETYTSSGAYEFVMTNVAGCDSIITLNLTIHDVTTTTVTVSSCEAYTWALNGETYTTSGSYNHVLTSVAGCDSVITLNLTVEELSATATHDGNGTITSSTGTSYQWINCTDYTAIVGETSQEFVPSVNGSYAVIVTDGNCTDTSNCETIAHLSIKDVMTSTIALFPNPTASIVYVTMEAQQGLAEVCDMNGKVLQVVVIKSGDPINLAEYDRGIYTINIKTEFGSVVKKVIKN